MPGNHPCAVEDCPAQARPGQLMCLPHWRELPKALQRDVNRTWRNFRYDKPAYEEAREAAIAHYRGRRTVQGALF